MAIKTHLTKQEEAVTENGVQVRSSDPGIPVADQTWINTSENKLKYYDGAATQEIGGSGGSFISQPVSFTLTTSNLGGGGITNMVVYKQRVGNMLKIYGGFTTGATSGSPASFTLPDSLSIDTGAINTNGTQIVGYMERANSSEGKTFTVLADTTTDAQKVYFGMRRHPSYTDSLNVINGTGIGTTERVSFEFMVPISGWASALPSYASLL